MGIAMEAHGRTLRLLRAHKVQSAPQDGMLGLDCWLRELAPPKPPLDIQKRIRSVHTPVCTAVQTVSRELILNLNLDTKFTGIVVPRVGCWMPAACGHDLD
eukprot:SAG31_NODE_5870_length_2281_cov_1.611366_1_plen_101_part_00